MLQVDANIGGCQDQKNQKLRTKTLAVGLMTMLGCFGAVGYFSATTTTTTANTRVSSPNVDGMVSNLQHYPYFTITNKTPYDVTKAHGGNIVFYRAEGFCSHDPYSVAAGQTWTASSRGACLVTRIDAVLTLPADHPHARSGSLSCTPYTSAGTSYSIYSIWLKSDDTCVVRSSHETK